MCVCVRGEHPFSPGRAGVGIGVEHATQAHEQHGGGGAVRRHQILANAEPPDVALAGALQRAGHQTVARQAGTVRQFAASRGSGGQGAVGQGAPGELVPVGVVGAHGDERDVVQGDVQLGRRHEVLEGDGEAVTRVVVGILGLRRPEGLQGQQPVGKHPDGAGAGGHLGHQQALARVGDLHCGGWVFAALGRSPGLTRLDHLPLEDAACGLPPPKNERL